MHYRMAVLAYFPYYTELHVCGAPLPNYQPSTTYANVSRTSLTETYPPELEPTWKRMSDTVKKLKELVARKANHGQSSQLCEKLSEWCTEFADRGEGWWQSLAIPDSARWLSHNQWVPEFPGMLRHVVQSAVNALYELVVDNHLIDELYVGLFRAIAFPRSFADVGSPRRS